MPSKKPSPKSRKASSSKKMPNLAPKTRAQDSVRGGAREILTKSPAYKGT